MRVSFVISTEEFIQDWLPKEDEDVFRRFSSLPFPRLLGQSFALSELRSNRSSLRDKDARSFLHNRVSGQ